jgi:fatty-acyl-CoA synthase
MIRSTMQEFPLTIGAIMRHGASVFGNSECVTWTGADSEPRRITYRDLAANAARLASALAKLGIQPGDAVGTMCWNNAEHMEAYFAVPGMGAVLHTLNIRLAPTQIAHIINHAGDKAIIVDDSLVPLLAAIKDHLPNVTTFIVNGPGDASALGDKVLRYHELVKTEEPRYDWPDLDERAAALMCYTSGTTGDPKGVVYSHRSTFLHALAATSACIEGITEADRVLVIVPMFHVNAWGLPFAAFMSGATLHMPGPFLQAEHVTSFIKAERSTLTSAIPTIWSWILDYGDEHEIDLSSLRSGTSGGAAAPRSLFERFQEKYGVRIVQGWGMTETSPLGGMAFPPPGLDKDSPEAMDWRMKSGRVMAGVEMRIISPAGQELPWDGVSEGEIEVRGPWITGSYHNDPAPDKFRDGWLRTGDIATIDERGFFQITDRVKDVIKSGGEWISSVALENELMGHPAVREAAVIGIPDEQWTERPLACVVPRIETTPAELRAFLEGKVAHWQVPENWTFVEEIPKTTVGKFDKKVLRARYAAGELKVDRITDASPSPSPPPPRTSM